MSVDATAGFRELPQVFDDEDESLLEDSAPPVETKVSALREAVFCTAAGAIAGGGTAILIAGLGYVNSGVGATFAVAGIAGASASALGALVGTVAKRALANANGCRIGRGVLGAFATCSAALAICNVAAWGQPNLLSMPLWSQFAVGVPAAVVGFGASAWPRTPAMGAIVTGGLVSLATGTLVGASLGAGFGAASAAIGPGIGAMYGLTGIQAVSGYAFFRMAGK